MMCQSSVQTRVIRGSVIFIILFLFTTAASATNWYVRSDGGNASQCTGLADAAYSGSGSGQACAWNHPFVALPPDGSAARIQGGDTLHIGSGDYMMGHGAPNTENCYESGSYECYMAQIPSGPSPSQPTRILGAGHDKGCTQAPELWGTERAWMVVNLEGSSNVELSCLEITDRSSCILSHCNGGNCEGEVAACKSSGSAPFGDWATTGISARDSSQVVLKDVNIHGLANRGIHAGRISDWTIERTRINANGWIGWDGDLAAGEGSSNSGAISFLESEIGYNGCAERWPGGEIFGCWGQKAGGYGDGLGVGESGGHWIFEDSTVHHNTSDGIDLLYLNDQGQVTVRRTLVDSNAGNQIKVSRSALIENSVVVGNCSYFRDEGNMLDGDHCRASGDTVYVGLSNNSKTDLVNNTIVSQGNCAISGGGGSTASQLNLVNNVIIGKDYWLDPSKLSCLYYSGSSEQITWTRNLISNVRNGACPGDSRCDTVPGIVSSALDSFDPAPRSTSPLIDAANPVLAPSEDFRRLARPAGNGPDIGAVEYAAGQHAEEPSDRIFGSRFN